MKNLGLVVPGGTTVALPRKVVGFFAFGLAVSLQMAVTAGPAQALKIYAEQNGNIPCSTCHNRTGLATGNMKLLTYKGQYFRTYSQLPPVPQPVPQPTPQPAPQPYPPVVSPQPPYVPPQPPVVRPPAGGHKAWCARKYRSYKPWNDTYRGYDGYDHRCISPYSRGGQAPVRPVYPRPVRPVRPVYPRPIPQPPRKTRNFSCSEAVGIARRAGYRNVFKKNCFDFGRYTLYATKGGYNWRLRIRASNGRIYKVTPR